jgi:hypothetical protein
MHFIIWLVVLILDILAIIDVAGRSMEMLKKVLWILLILFLPILGIVLYYLVGRSKS